MADKFYATRDKCGDDSVRIWRGNPDRFQDGSSVRWFSSQSTTSGLLLGKIDCSVIQKLFPDLLGLDPGEIREIAPPAIRFVG